MKTHAEYNGKVASQRLADLQDKTAELERQLSDARISLEQELAGSARSSHSGSPVDYSDERTQRLLDFGRSTAHRHGSWRRKKMAAGTAFAAALVVLAALVLSRGGPSWPASVMTVQKQIPRACQNPDVKAEPTQLNFACGEHTRQILWVLALLTSGNNSSFASGKTGRVGLEPITPAQGGAVAWTLNLHHPYDPTNPIDSLQVAARAINNIIGGATLTKANGQPDVQPGLESDPGNCQRYTGSAALTSREGYPRLCAKAITTSAGQAALVSDVYRKWVVGASPAEAQDAAVLFQNAKNPGDPRVQAILKRLAARGPQP
jgi:hypothetical protein